LRYFVRASFATGLKGDEAWETPSPAGCIASRTRCCAVSTAAGIFSSIGLTSGPLPDLFSP
jgi:hypothetical protein